MLIEKHVWILALYMKNEVVSLEYLVEDLLQHLSPSWDFS